jgi:hypothetical protein
MAWLKKITDYLKVPQKLQTNGTNEVISTHVIFNTDVGMKLHQYLNHFRVAIAGCLVKSCVASLWGKV